MKKKWKYLPGLFIIVGCLASGCLNDDPTTPVSTPVVIKVPSTFTPWVPEQGIYITGYREDETGQSAYLWSEDGVTLTPINAQYSWASSVVINDEDIYVVGTDMSTDCSKSPCLHMAVLWKNGEPLVLPSDMEESIANSIFVDGEDVYIAGAMYSHTSQDYKATMWKNGEPEVLYTSKNYLEAQKVVVEGDDVYGILNEYTFDYSKAFLWKNGEVQEFDMNIIRSFQDIYVTNDDVFLVGNDLTGTVLWENGVENVLSHREGTYASSLFVKEEDVYVTGVKYYDGEPRTMVWKNGELTPPFNGVQRGVANAVAVSGEDYYAVGYIGKEAVIWKNGEPRSLGKGDAKSLYINNLE